MVVVEIRYLKVIFNQEIKSWEVPAFRGAIIAKTGVDNLLFHNHTQTGYRYAYPLIQYKKIYSKAAIVCLTQGVDEIHKFFSNSSWQLAISGKQLDFKVDELKMNQLKLQLWNKQFSYKLLKWIALNQKSYTEYRTLNSTKDQIQYLESKLIGNILSMAKGIGWFIEKPIKCQIDDNIEISTVKAKGVKVLAFNIQFTTNVYLPEHIGLGNNVSFGYGVVQNMHN